MTSILIETSIYSIINMNLIERVIVWQQNMMKVQ